MAHGYLLSWPGQRARGLADRQAGPAISERGCLAVPDAMLHWMRHTTWLRWPHHGTALLVAMPGLIVLGLLLLIYPQAAHAEAPRADERADAVVEAALSYLRTQVTPEGGLDAFGNGPDPSASARAVLALATLGRDQDILANAATGATPLDYVISSAITYTHEPGYSDTAHLFPGNAGIVVAALSAAALDPRTSTGLDLIEQLEATLQDTGAYSTTARSGYTTGEALATNQAWAILGLSMAGRSVPPEAIEYLWELQAADGSWLDGDPDTTGLALVALMSSGQLGLAHPGLQAALGFLEATQLPGGGWRPAWDTEPLNVNSTAWAVQALLACGYAPTDVPWRGSAPAEALLQAQQADGRLGGSYANAYSTVEGLLGLAEAPLFLTPALRVQRGLAWLATQAREPGLTTGMAVDIALAYASAGYDPGTVPWANGSLLDQILRDGPDYARRSVDQAGKLALLLGSLSPTATGSLRSEVLEIVEGSYRPEVSAFGIVTNTYHQAYALLGLAALGGHIPEEAHQGLVALQQPDGGWKYDLGPAEWNTTTPDNTGLALQALVAAGVPTEAPAIQQALAHLASTQDANGDWGNANATALAIQALYAAGQDEHTWSGAGGITPLAALSRYAKSDGPFVWMWDSPYGPPEDNAMATAQAIPALAGRPLISSPGALASYAPIPRGPDPDGLLVGEPNLRRVDDQFMAELSLAGDIDGDAIFMAAWLDPGAQRWQSVEAIRDSRLLRVVGPNGLGSRGFRLAIYDPDGLVASGREGRLLTLVSVVTPGCCRSQAGECIKAPIVHLWIH